MKTAEIEFLNMVASEILQEFDRIEAPYYHITKSLCRVN